MAVNGLGEVEMGDFDFMNNPNFGAPGGVIANQAAQANDLTMQSQRNQLAVQPQMLMAQLANTQAEGSLHGAQAGLANFQLQKAQLFAQQLAKVGINPNGSDGKPLDMSGMLMQLANTAQSVGDIDAMQHYYGMAVQNAGHSAAMANAQSRMRMAQYRENMSQSGQLASDLEYVQDQAGLDAVGAKYSAQHNGEPPPWSKLPPGTPIPMIKQIVNRAATTAQQRWTDDFKGWQEDQKTQNPRNNMELQQKLADIKEKEVEARQAALDLKAKQGGSITGKPSKAEIDMFMDKIKSDFPDLAAKPEATVQAETMAMDMRSRMRVNPNLNPSEVAADVYGARKGGLATAVDPAKLPTGKAATGPTLGTTRDLPLPLANPADRVQGNYYMNKGKVLKWDPAGDPNKPWTD